MELQEVIRKRRTVHSFSNQIVPEEFIEKAIEAANYAPCHRLTFPWRFKSVSFSKRESIDLISSSKSTFNCSKSKKQLFPP